MATETSLRPISQGALRDLLIAYRSENWKGIQTPEVQVQIAEAMLHPDAEAVLKPIAEFWNLPPEARILDVGSGAGGFVTACRQLGYRAFGVEPDRIGAGGHLTSIQIASRRVPANVFAAAMGEALPFADGTFDLVTLNQVVEHVEDRLAVFREAARVVRSGGAIYVTCPNYLRFYEPHYKVFWWPLLPKPVGRIYLRLRGRNPVMLQHIHYTTNRRLRRLVNALGDEFTVLDVHQEQFKLKCGGQGTFESASARFAQKLMSLPWLAPLARKVSSLWLRLSEGGCEMLLFRKGDTK